MDEDVMERDGAVSAASGSQCRGFFFGNEDIEILEADATSRDGSQEGTWQPSASISIPISST